MESTKANIQLKVDLLKLSQHFDCLGLPTININVDVLHQVIISTSRLVQMYRQSLAKLQEEKLTSAQLEEELKMKKNKIESLKDQIQDVEKDLKKETNSFANLQTEIDELKKKLVERDRDVQRARLYNKNKDLEWSHKVKRLQLDIDKLKGETTHTSQYFRSQDEIQVKIRAQYKVKEEVYEETIKILQENNDDLQRQILNLRDIVVILNKQEETDQT